MAGTGDPHGSPLPEARERESLPGPAGSLSRAAGEGQGQGAPYDADVVILSLDRTGETIEAARSAASQRGVSKRVWLVDQGSTPENFTALQAAVAGLPDVTVTRLDRNHGVAGGRNRGSALGRGRVIVALDNDAEFAAPDTLARCVAALDDAPDLAAIGVRIVIHSTGQDDLSSWGYPLSLLPRAAERFDTVTFVGAGHAIRRADFERFGGYDDALFFTWEEYDFCLRAIDAGRRVAYDGTLVVRHKVSPERRFAWGGTRYFYFVRNRLYIDAKWGASMPFLVTKWSAYWLKGLRNGVAGQAMRALPEARRLLRDWRRTSTPRPLSPAGAAYVAANDRAHRGSTAARMRRELLAALPGRA
jgi:GT2 family glycosyltransferase